MMKIRLELMYELLSDDGVIFVHIDDTEMPYLKILLVYIIIERVMNIYFLILDILKKK